MNRDPAVDDKRVYGDAHAGPAPGRVRRDRARSLAVAAFAVVLVAAAGATFVAATSTKSWFPKSWDPRVAPIAAEVAKLRGLDFEHAVPIRYLTPEDFKKEMGVNDAPSSDERAEVAREASVFRSLGFISGSVDLLKAFNTSESSVVLAYYEPDHQDIIVRGTTLDVEHRVTIAHELTHVLQDQHFDITALQKRATDASAGDSGSLQALIEGDAVRIQQDYLKQLSSADRKEYDREDNAETQRIGKETASVPDIVDLLSSAPYELGPSTIRVLLESGGNAAVNDALTGPTPGSGVLVDAGDVTPPVPVDQPIIPSGAVVVGKAETFGPFETYLTLAMRLDAGRALQAADVVAGGEAVTFRSAGSTCYRVVLAPTFEHSHDFLLSAIQAWAHGRPHTTVDAAGDRVGFTACDPGKRATGPAPAQFHTAVDLLEIRTGITVAAAQGHESGALARCFARVFVTEPGAEKLVLAVGDGTPTASQEATIRSFGADSAEQCRADPDSGLP